MSKLFLFITLFLITVLVIAGNVDAHQYPAKRSMLPFPHIKNHRELNIVQNVEIHIPKVYDVKADKTLPSIITMPKMEHYGLREFDLKYLTRREVIQCFWGSDCITLGEVIIPPFGSSPSIIGPIADPFNDNFSVTGSFKEFFLWMREYGW